MGTILNLAILDSAIFVFPLKLTHTCQEWFPPFAQKNFTHSFWFNLMMAAILNLLTCIQPFCTKLWLKLIQSDSNSFILTYLVDGSHLEFCHLEFGQLWFSHLSFSSQTHSHLSRLVPTICTKKTTISLPSPLFAKKKTSLIHSDSTWC